MSSTASFTACSYCGNGIQYGTSHNFCSQCHFRFCESCVSSHLSAHSYSTYTMIAYPTMTDSWQPRTCTACSKLAHSHVACQRTDCKYALCTGCFDASLDERAMHEHDELFVVGLPHRESLDKFEVGCRACRESKAFTHCTRCLEGIQPSSNFYSCMDCLRIYDDVTATANLCETCMSAVRVTPQSLNHRFASFMFVIDGEDDNWSVSCSQCNILLANLDTNIVSRHAHNSWKITMGRKLAETHPQRAMRVCARTSMASLPIASYSYPSPLPSPLAASQENAPLNSTIGTAAPETPRNIQSPAPQSDAGSTGNLTRHASVVSNGQYAPPAVLPQAQTTAASVKSVSPDLGSSQMSQSFSRMSVSYPQTPMSPTRQQSTGVTSTIPSQTQIPLSASPQQMAPPQPQPQQQTAPAALATYPQASQGPHARQPSYSSIHQPTPTQGRNLLQHQARPAAYPQYQQQYAGHQQPMQPGAAAAQHRPMVMHANTAPPGAFPQMQVPQQQGMMYMNAQGQVVHPVQAQPQPQQYVMTQQVINGQLVNVQVPQAPGMVMQGQPMALPAAQMMQAQPQGMAMVSVRTANGTTVLVPQSSIQVVGGVPRVKPGTLPGSAAGAGRTQTVAKAQANAQAKQNAESDKFLKDIAKVAVSSLVKSTVRGAFSAI